MPSFEMPIMCDLRCQLCDTKMKKTLTMKTGYIKAEKPLRKTAISNKFYSTTNSTQPVLADVKLQVDQKDNHKSQKSIV